MLDGFYVQKTGCETFVIKFDDEQQQNHHGTFTRDMPPKRLRPLKKTPHRLKVRPREENSSIQRPFTANVGQVKKEKPIQSRQGLRSAFASRPAKSSKGKKK